MFNAAEEQTRIVIREKKGVLKGGGMNLKRIASSKGIIWISPAANLAGSRGVP